MLRNGFYSVNFSTPQGMGDGLILVRNGVVRGGDHGFIYQGELTLSGTATSNGQVTGTLHIKRYRQGEKSVFGPIPEFSLTVKGTFESRTFDLHGTTPAAPNMTIQIRGQHVNDEA